MFILRVEDVEFLAGPTPADDAWLIWLPGDFWEPYYGSYWVAALEQGRASNDRLLW